MRIVYLVFLVVCLTEVQMAHGGVPRNLISDPNKEYLECGTSCPAKCGVDQSSVLCLGVCVEGWFCKEGFILNHENKCVEPKDCRTKIIPGIEVNPDPNKEYSECGTSCPAKCGVDQSSVLCLGVCVEGWFCKEGFILNHENKCVEPKDCRTKIIPGIEVNPDPNKEYSECGTSCPAKCGVDQSSVLCLGVCVEGWFCKEGFILNHENKCVEPKDCRTKIIPGIEVNPDPNKEYSECGTSCPAKCGVDQSSVLCLGVCVEGWFCKEGFILNHENKCVEPKDCRTKIIPGIEVNPDPNKEYSECGTSCPAKCGVDQSSVLCLGVCVEGWFCKEGFILNHENKCVEPKDCRTKIIPGIEVNPDPNKEYSECGTSCPAKCGVDQSSVLCLGVCVEGWFCKEGFILNHENKCVEPKDCRTKIIPGIEVNPDPNKEYSECGTSCPAKCGVDQSSVLCLGVCVEGWFCKEGFILNHENKCVEPKDCRTKIIPGIEVNPDPNKEYSECGTSCPAKCGVDQSSVLCLGVCVEGWFCKEGFILNHENKCVEPKDCRTKIIPGIEVNPDPNKEYSECGTSCPAKCGVDQSSVLCLGVCVEGWFCKEGFILNHENKCVEPKDCRTKIIPGIEVNPDPNKEYSECGTSCPAKCGVDQSSVLCLGVCVEGWFCKEGFILNHENKCVEPKDCRTKIIPGIEVNPDPNKEYLECGTSCPAKCGVDQSSVLCLGVCVEGWFCKEGFILNHENKCVEPKDCRTKIIPGIEG